MKSLNFDMETMPPTAEALAQATRDLEAELRAIRKREIWAGLACPLGLGMVIGGVFLAGHGQWMAPGAVVVAVGILGVLAAAATVWTCAGEEWIDRTVGVGLLWALVMLGGLSVESVAWVSGAATVAFLALGVALVHRQQNGVAKPAREAIERALEDLEIIAPEHCPQVLAWCKEHPQLAMYQSRVAEMPRFMVNGEVSAMREWVRSLSARDFERQRLAEQQAACAALRRPLAMACAPA